MLSWGMSTTSELCQRCGLCCDGTLFTRTPLHEREVDALRALSPLPGDEARAPGLAQPCAALRGSRCAIYAERPASCRGYECLLFGALVEGEVGLDDALAVVDEARVRTAAPDDGLPGFLDHHFGRRRPC